MEFLVEHYGPIILFSLLIFALSFIRKIKRVLVPLVCIGVGLTLFLIGVFIGNWAGFGFVIIGLMVFYSSILATIFVWLFEVFRNRFAKRIN